MRRDEATLLDIAEAARLVVSFVQDMSKAAFLDDYKFQPTPTHVPFNERELAWLSSWSTDIPWARLKRLALGYSYAAASINASLACS